MPQDLRNIHGHLEERRSKTVMGFLPEDGLLLQKFVRDFNIKTVVETGVCYGFTSAYILSALPPNGKLISIEPLMKSFDEMVIPKYLRKNWIPIQQFSTLALPEVLKAFQPIDFFFHDSHHFYETMKFEYETAFPYARFIGSDDVECPEGRGAWKEFVKKFNLTEIVKGRRFAIAYKGDPFPEGGILPEC